MSTQSETACIATGIAACEHEFQAMVQKYRPLVQSIVTIGTGDLAQSEELTQDTLLLAWKHIGQLHDTDKFPGWLCRIAHNTVNSWHRRCRCDVVARSVPPEIFAALPSASPGPIEIAIEREQVELIRRALAAIPTKYSEPLVFYYYDKRSSHEIAEMMGLSPNAVRQRIHRGLCLLREMTTGLIESTKGPEYTIATEEGRCPNFVA